MRDAEFFVRLDPFDNEPHIIIAQRHADGSLLDTFYQEINCDTIDIVRTRFTFDDANILFVCDDNALIKGLQKYNYIATVLYSCRQQIFGPVIVGLSGMINGEPDIVGFDSMLDAAIAAHKIRELAIPDGDPLEWDIRHD